MEGSGGRRRGKGGCGGVWGRVVVVVVKLPSPSRHSGLSCAQRSGHT